MFQLVCVYFINLKFVYCSALKHFTNWNDQGLKAAPASVSVNPSEMIWRINPKSASFSSQEYFFASLTQHIVSLWFKNSLSCCFWHLVMTRRCLTSWEENNCCVNRDRENKTQRTRPLVSHFFKTMTQRNRNKSPRVRVITVYPAALTPAGGAVTFKGPGWKTHLCVSSELQELLFSLPENEPLYLNTVYLHQEQVLSTEAAMFFEVAQTEPFLSCYDNWSFHRFSRVWKGRVRGVQLQHDTSPLDVTKLYTLNL